MLFCNKLRQNLQKMRFKTINIQNYKCFKKLELDCTKKDGSIHQWTVLLGNNNTGKTSVLKAIANLRPILLRKGDGNRINFLEESKIDKEYVPVEFFYGEVLKGAKEDANVACTTTIPELGPWEYGDDGFSVGLNPQLEKFRIYAYGVSRYPSKTSLSESGCGDCASLFSSEQRLVNMEEWLMQLDYAAKNENVEANKRLNRIHELLCSKLFPEIKDFKFESSDELHNYVLFLTDDGWFRYTQLGYGYQSMLSWVVDFCTRMFERYPDSENPLGENAIVLIDEIDLHLHPMWQRNIISFLSNAFPNVQFIVTTHSPLVIQSMNEVNLYVLHRDGDQIVAEHSEVSNFQGWTVEEILRDTMRMEEDTRSDHYQKYIRLFDDGLDKADKEKVNEAYRVLCEILHPENPIRRILEFQRSQMEEDDKA